MACVTWSYLATVLLLAVLLAPACWATHDDDEDDDIIGVHDIDDDDDDDSFRKVHPQHEGNLDFGYGSGSGSGRGSAAREALAKEKAKGRGSGSAPRQGNLRFFTPGPSFSIPSDEVLETVPSGYRISSQGRVEPIDDDDDDYGPDDDEYNIPASDTVILNDNLVFDSDDVKDEGVARPDFSMLGFALTLLSVFFLLVN